MPAERALIRLQNSVYEMEQLTRQLSLLMEDDKVEEGEQTSRHKGGLQAPLYGHSYNCRKEFDDSDTI